MEVCVSVDKTDLSDPTNFNLKTPSVNGLKVCLKEFISVEDTGISATSLNTSSEKIHTGGTIASEDDSIKSDNSASGKCFDNRVTFLALGKSKLYADGGNVLKEDDAFDSSCVKLCAKPTDQAHSQSTPPKPLVSAMKGNREKQGTKPDKKLSVSWGADVYDPIPTSVSHVPSNTTNRKKRGKRNNKKQKPNVEKSSSRKRKDKKKQAQKSNNENPGEKLKKGIENELDSNYSSSIVNRVTDQSSCGSSFLKESMSGANLHFPVTEAKG